MADAMKLLPCPMCGGEAALLDYEARYGGLHYASRCPQCTSCGCSMGYLPTAKKAVEAWNCRASMPAPEKAPSFADARRKLIHCIEQWDGETEYDAEDIAALADDILDAFGGPPAREEAPAEGAGEREEIARIIDPAAFLFAQDELMKGDPSQFNALSKADRIIAALRNRTSEPEAGEAVPFMWAYEAVTDGEWRAFPRQLQRADGSICPGRALFTHPAPATADKLREIAKGLDAAMSWVDYPFVENNTPEAEIRQRLGFMQKDAEPHRQALTALNEQPQ